MIYSFNLLYYLPGNPLTPWITYNVFLFLFVWPVGYPFTLLIYSWCTLCIYLPFVLDSRRGRANMVVGFTTTCAISSYHNKIILSSNPVHCEVYSIQHYVIKFVSDLRQAGGLLRVLRFPPPIKLTTTI